MSSLPEPFLTPEQYLEIERKAEFKSEYFRGEMFAMSGARAPHVLIVYNVSGELRQQLRGKPCNGYPVDMRVLVADTGLYTYPDFTVTCGEPQYLDARQDTLLNPTIIVEVLSESTEAYDRGKKFQLYRSLASLQEYVLISSLGVSVERYSKQPNGTWNYDAKTNLSESIDLKSIDCRLALADIYDRIQFEAHEAGSAPEPQK